MNDFKNKTKSLPDISYLKECFRYDPEEGVLIWLNRPARHFSSEARAARWNRDYAGKPAGCKHTMKNGKKQYMQVRLRGQGSGCEAFLVHRIIAAMMGSNITNDFMVDHIDGDVWNHKWSNLRLATASENSRNCKPHADKKSKYPRGVYQQKGRRGFFARISLGCFKTPELAHEAYCRVAKMLHGEFARFD